MHIEDADVVLERSHAAGSCSIPPAEKEAVEHVNSLAEGTHKT